MGELIERIKLSGLVNSESVPDFFKKNSLLLYETYISSDDDVKLNTGLLMEPVLLTEPVNDVAVIPPGNELFPDPSNKVAVLTKEENTPEYCLTCIGSVPSSAVAISTKPPFVAVPPTLIRN